MNHKYEELKENFNHLKIKHEMLVRKVQHGCTDASCKECDGIKAQILTEKDVHASGVGACDGCSAPLYAGDVYYDSSGGYAVACSIDCIQIVRSFVMVYRDKNKNLIDPPSTCVIEGNNLEFVEEVFEHSYADCDLLWVVESDNAEDAITDWLNGGES